MRQQATCSRTFLHEATRTPTLFVAPHAAQDAVAKPTITALPIAVATGCFIVTIFILFLYPLNARAAFGYGAPPNVGLRQLGERWRIRQQRYRIMSLRIRIPF